MRTAGARAKGLFAAVVTALSAALALGAGEALLRLGAPPPRDRDEGAEMYRYHPLLGWSLAPGTRTRQRSGEFDVAVRINAQGFRADREVAPRPPPGTLRMVAVGDSFTFGQGVEAEEAWPALLERRLPRTEVVNLGVPGYGTDQQLLTLERRGLAFHPEVVLLGLYMTNVFRNDDLVHGRYGKPRFRRGADGRLELTNVPVPRDPAAAPARGWEARSRLYSTVAEKLRYRGFGEAWELTGAIVARLAASAERAGAQLVVVVLPTQPAVEGPALTRKLQARSLARLREVLPAGDHEVVDATPALADRAARDPATRLFHPLDGHLTAAGHRVVAEAVARRIEALRARGRG